MLVVIKTEVSTWQDLLKTFWVDAIDTLNEIEAQGRENEALCLLEERFNSNEHREGVSEYEINKYISEQLAEDMNLYDNGDKEETETIKRFIQYVKDEYGMEIDPKDIEFAQGDGASFTCYDEDIDKDRLLYSLGIELEEDLEDVVLKYIEVNIDRIDHHYCHKNTVKAQVISYGDEYDGEDYENVSSAINKIADEIKVKLEKLKNKLCDDIYKALQKEKGLLDDH